MSEFYISKTISIMPRLPLEANIDLTYRCNNNCRHCWLRIPPNAPEKKDELSFEEICDIVDQARALGTRKWSISGGEPMLRPDFPEIFDYITSKTNGYGLNTNGALITPKIAQLMRRKGSKLVALYGATAEVNDHITRSPGSFDATMRGFAYLKEAGAGFTVQLIPMCDNYHQWDQMQTLAQSLSKTWRCGAPWLYLSACGDEAKNAEIIQQRLDPVDVIELDNPDTSDIYTVQEGTNEAHHLSRHSKYNDRLFASCIEARRDFHVDPYGGMTFCGFIKDPALIYDLRQGSVQDGWERFIPSLVDQVRGGSEYQENCADCDLRNDCRWCPVYGYLEHRRYSAKVDYLCEVAREAQRFKQSWTENQRRFYEIAGITIQIDSDLPILDTTFEKKFADFRVDGAGDDTVRIQHHFTLPDLDGQDLGEEVYRRVPWAIYKKGGSWIYKGISPSSSDQTPRVVAVFNQDHSNARIYHRDDERWIKGGINALTLFASDQIMISRLLAERQGCYFHSSGVILNGQGLLFVGHSEAGKSTISRMLEPYGQVLCDDRNIVRRLPDGFQVYGTWSHGEWPVVSAASGPLRAVMFLEQASENLLLPLSDRKQIVKHLISCLIKPFETVDWWESSLDLIEAMANELPIYKLHFDKSGEIVSVLQNIVSKPD